MRYAKVDQARLFAAGHHVDPVAQNLTDLTNELGSIARLAQCIGTDHTHRRLRQTVDQLREPTQAVEPALHRFFAEVAVLAQPGAQLNFLAQALENANLTMVDSCQHHVKTVGAKINGSNQRQFGLFCVGHAHTLVELPGILAPMKTFVGQPRRGDRDFPTLARGCYDCRKLRQLYSHSPWRVS